MIAAPADPRPPLLGMDLEELAARMQGAGRPRFRATQIFQWIYEKNAADFDAMTNLPKEMRAWLAETFRIGGMIPVEAHGEPDATQKIVYRAGDGELVESVLMRGEEPEDEEEAEEAPKGSTPPQRKVSLCVSSQVGCALNCAFCMTGRGGFVRDLTVDEILCQATEARRRLAPDERLANVVFMGMGEPLLNLKAVLPALRLLTSPQAFGVSTRRVTLSTAGVVPGIEELARSRADVCLAVSLNATTQSVRDRLMPGVRRWPLAELLEACRRYPLIKRRRITFEYVLLRGVNDGPDDLRRLPRLLHGIPCKINLILYNPSETDEFEPTGEDRAEAFRSALCEADCTASLRRSKGRRHQAACGQLAAHARRRRDGAGGPPLSRS